MQTGKNAVENNHLSASQSLSFDKELRECQKSGGYCQYVIDKWKRVSDKQSKDIDDRLQDNPLGSQVIDKEVVKGGMEMSERPGWLGNFPGMDVMTKSLRSAMERPGLGEDRPE